MILETVMLTFLIPACEAALGNGRAWTPIEPGSSEGARLYAPIIDGESTSACATFYSSSSATIYNFKITVSEIYIERYVEYFSDSTSHSIVYKFDLDAGGVYGRSITNSRLDWNFESCFVEAVLSASPQFQSIDYLSIDDCI